MRPFWLVLLAGACRPPDATVAGTQPHATAAPPNRPNGALVSVPPRVGRFWPFVDARGDTHVVVGTLRIDVSGDTVVAQDTFATQIAASAPVADGAWVFVAEDGSVARAPSFTGPLERLGEIPRSVQINGPQNGRIAVVDELGRAWTTDGTQAIDRLHTPEGSVLDVGFADAKHGAVVLDGGQLWLTDDGGESWDPVDQKTFAVVSLESRYNEVHPADFILLAATTDGGREVFRTPVAGPEAKIGKLDVDSVTLRTWRGTRQQARLRTNDRFAYTVDKQGVVERRDYETGRAIAHSDKLGGTDCRLIPWGPRLLAACDEPTVQAWSSADGLVFERLALSTNQHPRNIRWSDDGVHAVSDGPCVGDAPALRPDQKHVCARRADGWHTLVIARADLHTMHGASVLLWDAVLDVETGVVTPLAHSDQLAEQRGIIREVQWIPDGAIVALLESLAEKRSYVVIGPPAGPFTIHRIPIRTVEGVSLIPTPTVEGVSFIDRARGVVAGDDLADVWRTLDGGRTWEHVRPPVDGDPHRIAIDVNGATWRRLDGVQCRPTGCWIENRLVIDGWGALEPGARVLAAERPPARMQTDDSFLSLLSQHGTFDCSVDGAPAPVIDKVANGVRERILFGPQGSAVLAMRRGGALELSWQSDRKRLRSAGTLKHAVGDEASATAATYLLRATTKAGALVERCTGTTLEVCHLIWARAGGDLALVAPIERSLLGETGHLWVSVALPRKDGGVIALLQRYGTSTSQDVIASIAPDGATTLRWFAWSSPPGDAHGNGTQRALGRYHDELGYVFADAHDPHWLRFIPVESNLDTAAINLPWVVMDESGWARPTCADLPRSDDELEVIEPAHLSGVSYGHVSPEYALIRARITSAGMCVVEARSWGYGTALRDLIVPTGDLRATGNGNLSGTITNSDATRRLVCKN